MEQLTLFNEPDQVVFDEIGDTALFFKPFPAIMPRAKCVMDMGFVEIAMLPNRANKDKTLRRANLNHAKALFWIARAANF